MVNKFMNFENPTKNPILELEKEVKPNVKIEVESGYEDFIPKEFLADPMGYFESYGENIKSGEIIYNESGQRKEDPTKVKELPVWADKNGNQLNVIGKRISIGKGEMGRTENPFHEYDVMKILGTIGFPTSIPVAKVAHDGIYLLVMEKVSGIGWYEFEKKLPFFREQGFSEEIVRELKKQAEEQMQKVKEELEEAGVDKGRWKLNDMIFDIDIENKRIRNVVPVDWERAKIDFEKLEAYRNRN